MRKITFAGLFVASLVLLAGVVFALPPFGLPPGWNNPPGSDRFEPEPGGGLVVRHPKKAVVNKPFNIGIYINDTFAGGGDYDSANMTIDVTGPGTVVGWNSWFEVQGLSIQWGKDDLIVSPIGDVKSFEHKDLVSKLGDVPGWTGSIVCKADTAGTYTFEIDTFHMDGSMIGSWTFEIVVS